MDKLTLVGFRRLLDRESVHDANLVLDFFLCSGLFFGLGVVAAGVAYVKGYRPWFWLVSLGPIGALLMLLRPNLNRATTPEEREQWEQRADWTGGILSGMTLFFAMGFPIVGMLAFFSLRSVAVAPAPATIAVPAQPIVDELGEMPAPEPQASPVESTERTNSDKSSETPAEKDNDQTPPAGR